MRSQFLPATETKHREIDYSFFISVKGEEACVTAPSLSLMSDEVNFIIICGKFVSSQISVCVEPFDGLFVCFFPVYFVFWTQINFQLLGSAVSV